MLTRSDLKSLQSHRDYPSISILSPTHRMAPANKQDPIRVKNLVRKAVKRLHAEFPKREVAVVVENLERLVRNVDWQHTLEGLALFASRKKSVALSLPFRVKPRAMIDETFGTRDLVHSFLRASPYRVLVLGNRPARLFDAWTNLLEEHRGKPFPMTHRGPGGASKLPGGFGINPSAVRDDAQRTFFRAVEDAVAAIQRRNPLPLIVAGVERNLAFFREVTRQADSIIGQLAGSFDDTSAAALGKMTWPVFQTGMTNRNTDALVQLDSAVGANRHASGIDQVWRLAATGQCRTVLVEKDFKYPADVSEGGDQLQPYTGAGPRALDDAVDEIIEKVMDSGGEVYFLSPGSLDVHQKIAGIRTR